MNRPAYIDITAVPYPPLHNTHELRWPTEEEMQEFIEGMYDLGDEA